MFDWLEDVLLWLLDVLLFVPRKIYELLLQGLAAFINWIPVPQFMIDLNSNAGAMWASIGWWAEIAQIPEGVTLVLTAYGLRFIVRRLPVIG
jgi:hypothetical protein